MAISTYAQLQAACASWLVRGDLTARIPEFITLAEARLNRVLRARLAEADRSLTGTIGSRTISLPSEFAESLACWITPTGSTERCELRFVDPSLLTVFSDRGRPAAWTIDGPNLAFERPLDAAYPITLRMLAKYALSDDAPTNTLLTNAPDVYLFATLAEAGPFLRDAELAAAYETKLARAIAELNAKDHRSRAQSGLVTEVGELQRYGRSGGYNIFTDR
jgi:hypothetical protein